MSLVDHRHGCPSMLLADDLAQVQDDVISACVLWGELDLGFAVHVFCPGHDVAIRVVEKNVQLGDVGVTARGNLVLVALVERDQVVSRLALGELAGEDAVPRAPRQLKPAANAVALLEGSQYAAVGAWSG